MSEQKTKSSKNDQFESRLGAHKRAGSEAINLNSFSALCGGPLTSAWWTPSRRSKGLRSAERFFLFDALRPQTGLWEVFDVCPKPAVQHTYIYIIYIYICMYMARTNCNDVALDLPFVSLDPPHNGFGCGFCGGPGSAWWSGSQGRL